MPNKLTDAEVKKALECYRGQKLFSFNGKRPEIYIHDILDLINRLQAELKSNENIIRFADKTIETANAEIERLKIERDKEHDYCNHYARSLAHKCDDCAGCTQWKCDCANIERATYEKCIANVKEEIKQALESNHKAKHEHIEKHYQCLSCDFLATVRGKIDALSGLDYFCDNLLNELVGDKNAGEN